MVHDFANSNVALLNCTTGFSTAIFFDIAKVSVGVRI